MTVTATAVLLVAGCALAFSGADIARKLLGAWMRPIPILFALSAGLAPFFLLWFCFDQTPLPSSTYWVPGVASMLINVVANLAFIEALRRSPLSSTVPLLSLTPVCTSLLAIPMLGELPGWRQWLGIVAVVVGALWLNLEQGSLTPASAWRGFLAEPGSRLMVLVAVTWSLAMPLDKLAVQASTPSFHGLMLTFGVALALLVLASARGSLADLGDLRHRPGLVVFGILTSLVALALQLLAIRVVWVGFVETMKRGLGSFLAVLWGRVIFAEPFERQRLIAVALMVLGVSAILL